MEGPRPPREAEFLQVLDFLNQELRPDSKWSLASEYPTALNLSNIHNIRIITEQNQVLSHAVLKPLIVRTPQIIFKVGAIGSVVTDPNHRNQGLSRKILEECLTEAHRQDCDVAMLWTDLYDFYQKLDFELAGSELSFVLQNEFAPMTADLKFLKSTQVSVEAIHRLYTQHTITTVRTVEDFRKFMQIPNTVVYTAWDKSNQLVAFAIEGKGADLNGYIHEWGGSVSNLVSLLSFVRKEKKAPITVISPAISQNLNRTLQAIEGVVFNNGFLGMIKIIRQEQLFHKIRKAAAAKGIQKFILGKMANSVFLGIGDDQVAIADEKDLVRILFGPAVEIPHLQPETAAKLSKLLPLPLWLWGWDSI
jgi:GNAT superfamily N-acetyltransferase